MAVETNIAEHRPSSAAPDRSPEELVALAEAIAPTLVARQAETEERTFYAQDTHEAFADGGLYKILVPRRYGGYGCGIGTFLRVSMALARGCPSTGWMYCLGAAHALAAATFFPEQAQDELFASGEFICPLMIVPSGTAVRTGDGGWVLDGTWKYGSGSPYATHFMGHTMVDSGNGEPEPMLFVAPRSEWRRLDDWGGQLGLNGSGSHSIVMERGRIPGHFTIEATHASQAAVDQGTPGLTLHGDPVYAGGPLSFMNLETAALAVGMAKGALDAYEELMRTRTTVVPPIVSRAENPDYQYWYGEATALIATGEAAVFGAVQEWDRLCAAGTFTREQDLRLSGVARHVIKLCWRAVEEYVFPTAGSSSVRHGQRIERVWRDMSTFHTHSGISVLLPTMALRELAQLRFGTGG
jgi:3-hydroxy-9,10-secoandrosta-1,3,5(10)-triene-9,17-dione monooxygenase